MMTIGDMARSLSLRTNQLQLRHEMDKLSVEISTGVAKDSTRHLGGNISGLLSMDRSLERLETFRINTAEASLITGSMQSALGAIQDSSEGLAQVLVGSNFSQSDVMMDSLSNDAKDALDGVLNWLNKSAAGKFLFSGVDTNTPSVSGYDDFIAALDGATTGMTTLTDIELALDNFFDSGGDFETAIYTGADTSLSPLQLSETATAFVDVRADTEEIRNLLKPIALAALATMVSVESDVKSEMLASAGTNLLTAIGPFVNLRASLGALEARVEETSTSNESERTALTLARLDLVGIDDFEAAAKYESVRGKLESLYAITARSQRLSLAEYL